MIEVVVEKEPSEDVWSSRVSRCGGHALHLPAVQLVHQDPGAIRYLVFRRGGEEVACAIAVEAEARSRRWSLSRRRSLQLPTAPAVAPGANAWEVYEALIRFADQIGCDRLIVDPSNSRWPEDLEPLAAYRKHSITEFVLDLREGEEVVLARLHKTHRKNIRRAERQSLVVQEDTSLQGLSDLRDMQIASAQRASERTEGFGVSQQAHFERLHEKVYSRGLGHVLFASLDGRRVAALAWLSALGRAQTVRSGSLPDGYRLRAMYLLHDHLIRRLVAEGVAELNIGGVPSEADRPEHPQAGLYEFKAGFGGATVVRYALDIPLEEWRR